MALPVSGSPSAPKKTSDTRFAALASEIATKEALCANPDSGSEDKGEVGEGALNPFYERLCAIAEGVLANCLKTAHLLLDAVGWEGPAEPNMREADVIILIRLRAVAGDSFVNNFPGSPWLDLQTRCLPGRSTSGAAQSTTARSSSVRSRRGLPCAELTRRCWYTARCAYDSGGI